MKVIFSPLFIDHLRGFGTAWIPQVEELQSRLQTMTRTEFLSGNLVHRVPDSQEDMYVFRLGRLRLFALVNVGEKYNEDLIAFLDVSAREKGGQPIGLQYRG